MIVVLIGWIGAVIYTHDLFKNPEGIPNTKLRLKTYEILLKLLAWAFGFVVTLTGAQCFPTFFTLRNPLLATLEKA